MTLLLGVTLALSACGTQQAGAAAIIDGQSISDSDVQNVTLELNTLTQSTQSKDKLTPNIVLLNLIVSRFLLPEAQRTGKAVTEAQARKIIPRLPNPSRGTLDFIRMQMVAQSLSPASTAAILAKLGKAKVVINPRYGTFDAKRGIVATSPNWIKAVTPAGAK
jgi:hypothetical protein